MLAPYDLLCNIDFFHVHPPNDHSIHCLLSTVLSTGAPFKVIGSTNLPKKLEHSAKYQWKDGDDAKFCQALCAHDIQAKITNFGPISDVNEGVCTLNTILYEAASKAGIRHSTGKHGSRNPKVEHKNWYDVNCHVLKRELSSIASKLRMNPYNKQLLAFYQAKRKFYKKLVNKKKCSFKQGILNQMDSLEKKNPREFWALFDKLKSLNKHKQSPQSDISDSRWVEHFTKLLNGAQQNSVSSSNDSVDNFIEQNMDKIFNELNYSIKESEISRAISGLKKKKSSGIDMILNEMLKAGHTQILQPLGVLLNHILTFSSFPDSWRINFLLPIHKKGDCLIPSNYRGIAISSNLCKLFCSILNNRLSLFAESNKLIPSSQIGFRKKMRTADHIMTLKSIIDKYVNKLSKNYLFCCFVDFRAAFDSVPRKCLLYKLIKLGVGGNFLNVLKSIYIDVKYRVKISQDRISNVDISSNVGVKQGCVLSPLLFSLYTSDLPSYFNDCDPVTLHDAEISCLLFADDLVIISKTKSGLQSALDNLSSYCREWGLTVNLEKTKVLIFNKGGKLLNKHPFHLDGVKLDIVTNYCYLGILFTASGSFKMACERLTLLASRAAFKLKSFDTRNNIVLAYRLFNHLVTPILSYCCEIWCPLLTCTAPPEKLYDMCHNLPNEKVLLLYGKYLLGVNRRTTNSAVRGELGQYPLALQFLAQSIKYWLRISSDDMSSSLVNKAYIECNKNLSKTSLCNWAKCIRQLLIQCNLENVWVNQGSTKPRKIANVVRVELKNMYENTWFSIINDETKSPKLRSYKLFKNKFLLENYLISTTNLAHRRAFTKLRLSAHRLAIETGRYTVPKTPVDQRTCCICNENKIESEIHFLCDCSALSIIRRPFLSKLETFTNVHTFQFLMSYNNGDTEVGKIITELVFALWQHRNRLCIE